MKIHELIVEADQSRREALKKIGATGAGLATALTGSGVGINKIMTQVPKQRTTTTPAPPIDEPKSYPQISRKRVLSPEQRKLNLIHEAEQRGIHGLELAALLAQCSVESWQFRALESWKTEEQLRADAPYVKVGNTTRDDNWNYRARGLIHLFGRENYERLGKALNLPLLQNPDLAAEEDLAAKIAVEFWLQRVRPFVNRQARKINIDTTTLTPPTKASKPENIQRIPDWSNTAIVTYRINPKLELLKERNNEFKLMVPQVVDMEQGAKQLEEGKKKKSRSQKRRASRRVYGTIFGYSGDGNFDGGGEGA